MGRHPQRADLSLAARFIDRLNAVRLLSPGGGKRAASADADRAPHLRCVREGADARLALERRPNGILSRKLFDTCPGAAPSLLRDDARAKVLDDEDGQRGSVVGQTGTKLDVA